MHRSNTYNFDVKSALQVKARPQLWDKTYKDYSDNQKRENLWHEICLEMDSRWASLPSREKWRQEEELRKRWRSCRDRFRKDLAIKEKSGSSPTNRRPYQHFDELMFLAPTRSLRSTQGNFVDEDSNQTREADMEDESLPMSQGMDQDNVTFEEEMLSPVVAESPPPVPDESLPIAGRTRAVRRRNTQPTTANVSAIEIEAVNLLRKVGSEDLYDGFGHLVAGQCRNLPTEKQSTFMTFVVGIAEIFANTPILPGADIILKRLRNALAAPPPQLLPQILQQAAPGRRPTFSATALQQPVHLPRPPVPVYNPP
ncbi:uncharacterized protein [Engystomops pustulosus]|uniref:uncharacterized protein n=1 Tax=Engystomops pustulosus TaxID=76066 RepID=UPI003AFB1268